MTLTADPADRTPAHTSKLDRAALQHRLDELAAKHHVVGASFALLDGDDVIEIATGVANMRSGLPSTPQTLFQIGSVTKVFTATLVMQLVEQGKLDLDAPIARALPELRLSRPELTQTVTIRHLLTHTSGIDGDHFADMGRGDDVLELYVASCAQLPQLYTPGKLCSYSNAGWSILGRVVEVATGMTWDSALAGLLLQPLQCASTVTLPEQAIVHPVAIGHLPGEGADMTAPRPSPVWSLPRSLGPAGQICATAADVLRFARMHLDGGRAADGTQILSATTVASMQVPHVELIDPILGDFWALGWFGSDWEGGRSIGHDGNTIGQAAFLRLLPDHHVAATLLTTGGLSRAMYEELFSEVLADRAGVSVWRTPAVPEVPASIDLNVCAGTYERYGFRYEIAAGDDGTLTLTPHPTIDNPLLALVMTPQLRMVPHHGLTFVCYPPILPAARSTGTFAGVEDGRAQWVHIGGRLARRVDAVS
jgi:CubicO group peptidase (beta-lactamase class C family)